ncbi:MAG: hypothetical protein K8I00_06020, partial [Candidatus Omnitrophica bacterium]|nr:hypothetical protein [Candidatus Omnitrophota bacterium]
AVSLQQIRIVDPYLSTRIEIKSASRRWATTLPDGRVCSGETPAATLRQIGDVLTELSAIQSSDLKVCAQTAAEAQQQLDWTLGGKGREELKISPECLNVRPEVARAVRAVRGVSLSNTSRVKCR